jgi:starvation-inducible DNA-binding protein
MKVDIGINKEDRKEISEGLSKLLADSYTLYLKSHNFHWNVTGPHFQTLHLMFEEHYKELASAVDEIAERIRALGFPAPGSFSVFLDLATVQGENKVPSAEIMIGQLVKDHETILRIIRDLFSSTKKSHDETTADLLTKRMQVHEKTAWMLRSLQE